MGSNNRDYMRDEIGSGLPSWGHDVPTTKWLIIVSVGLFFAQTIFTHDVSLDDSAVPRVAVASLRSSVEPVAQAMFAVTKSYAEEWLLLEPDKLLHGQIWRAVTYVFCHPRNAPFAIVFNMIALWYLGSSLERMYGSREFLWFYLASAAFCALIFAAFSLKLYLPQPLIGANAPVLAMLALYATHFPRRELLFFGLIPIQIRVLLLIYVVVDVFQILQAFKGEGPWTRVAYMSELWGAAFGYLYRQQNWRLEGIADVFDFGRLKRSLRRATTSRNLKVFHPEVSTSGLDEQVDAILAKIHEQGSESLTERERSILKRASEQAKHRL
ncbi:MULTISPECIES: rhomboid family intramembrane serine protease [unclassified Schlesneria]|uniref:rhomboid family intramembrane serine protease n=1 Tax=Schlesneria TaxID=656899 RepID=UPI0035A16719